jgi:hypothetical protein
MFGEPVEELLEIKQHNVSKYYTGDCAEVGAYFEGPVLETSRLAALKPFLGKVFSSGRKNKLKWTILGT